MIRDIVLIETGGNLGYAGGNNVLFSMLSRMGAATTSGSSTMTHTGATGFARLDARGSVESSMCFVSGAAVLASHVFVLLLRSADTSRSTPSAAVPYFKGESSRCSITPKDLPAARLMRAYSAILWQDLASIDYHGGRVLHRGAIAISMDGKGSWRDNVFIERLWRLNSDAKCNALAH